MTNLWQFDSAVLLYEGLRRKLCVGAVLPRAAPRWPQQKRLQVRKCWFVVQSGRCLESLLGLELWKRLLPRLG